MSGPSKILIVDDDKLMHMLYRHHLERAGFQVLTAENGREAVEVATRELPQLIFMDIMMPQTDGMTALRELQKSETTKGIPVIVITSNVSEYIACRQEAIISGAAGFLSKPISPTQMIEEIHRQLPA